MGRVLAERYALASRRVDVHAPVDARELTEIDGEAGITVGDGPALTAS
jgi:hypothetical protein